jgi:NADPH2:quinone reductase
MARALVCKELGGEDLLEVREDWPAGPCGADQVRIDVRAASVNFPDTLVIRGLYQLKPELPFVPGSECSGVVSEVGSRVTELAVGDRVLALLGAGAFATEVLVATPPSQVLRIPDSMPWDDAAALNLTYGTAIHGLRRRADLRAANGADATIDHQAGGSIAARVREITDDHGADVVFDTVGGADVRDLLRAMAWNGRFLVVGFAGGEIPTFRANQTILKSISIVGVAYGASAIFEPASNRADFDQLFAWYRDGLIRPHIGHRFTLDSAADAIRVVTQRRALGKVVVEMRSGI